jgi:hypothetical protein
MSDQFLALLIESLVAVLLVLTIGYCMVLNHRLKRLRADESSLRTTIAELITGTQVAQSAIDKLKITVHECDATLGERLRVAERMTADLSRSIERGEDIIARIGTIATAAHVPERAKPDLAAIRPAPPAPAKGSVAQAVAAAQALVARSRHRAA